MCIIQIKKIKIIVLPWSKKNSINIQDQQHKCTQYNSNVLLLNIFKKIYVPPFTNMD